MKLSENQKNVFYIALTVFLGLFFVTVVFFTVQHFRNKNTNNCTRKCDGKNCGDNGCKGSCGTCTPPQTCGQDGICSCTPNCDGTCSTNDGCGNVCQGSCKISGYTCGKDGQCNPPPVTDCYGDNENPFQPPACGGKKLRCCDGLNFCKDITGNYYCRSSKVTGDICKGDTDFKYPDCTQILGCTGSSQFCPVTPDTNCYGDNENPFQPPACGGKKLTCCDSLNFCKDINGNYYCRSSKVTGDICKGDTDFKYPDCTQILGCTGSSQFCPKPGCISNCVGKNCGDNDNCGKPCQEGACQSGSTCISGKCNANPTSCYAAGEDPFGPPVACSQNRLKCCDNLQFCFKNNGYVCRDKKVVGDICKGDPTFKYPDCTKILSCSGSTQFCPDTACPDECKGINCGANCKACSGVCPIGTNCDPNWNVCVPTDCNDPDSLPCPSGFTCADAPNNCVPNN